MDIAWMTAIVAFALGFGAGCWFYRYTLKKNPAELEAWAARLKAQRRQLDK